jgi:hypothetical protein
LKNAKVESAVAVFNIEWPHALPGTTAFLALLDCPAFSNGYEFGMELRTLVERARSPRFCFCYTAKGMALLSNFCPMCVASVIRENQMTDRLTRASLINEIKHLSALLP